MDEVLHIFGAFDDEFLFICSGSDAGKIGDYVRGGEALDEREVLFQDRVDILAVRAEVLAHRLLVGVRPHEHVLVNRAHHTAALGVGGGLAEIDQPH